jgi:dihydropteridine reductase
MLGYGLAKAAVHQLTASLAEADGGLPSGTSVTAILPTTLDTPGNRDGMPDADFSSWTSCDSLADRLVQWSEDRATRPDQGELVSV